MEHKDIPDSQRHEPKGASLAVDKQALFANGDGTTTFRTITPADIPGLTLNGYDLVLSGFSTAVAQNPSAVDTALQVEFGASQTVAAAALATNGTITFNHDGEYLLTLFLRFGRTTGAGTAVLLNRLLFNDVQLLRTNAVALTDSAATIPFSATILVQAQAGDTLKMEVARDSAGINNGGLVRTTPTALAWAASPSASFALYKLGE